MAMTDGKGGKGRIRTLLEVDETIRDLGKTLVHLETSLDTLDPVLDQLGSSLTRLDAAIGGLEHTVEQFGGVVDRADRLLDAIERVVHPMTHNPVVALPAQAAGVAGKVASGVWGAATRRSGR